MSFFSRLEARARQTDSLLCVGLDPHTSDLPAVTAEAVRGFCLRLIDATWEHALAFKPNSAFFEVLGAQGMAVLQEVIRAVPAGVPVILDAKRGDIASTADAYVQAVFQTFGAAAVTVSPYLGRDSVQPFLADPQHGIFLLCKTSNPGAVDLQDLPVLPDGLRLYEHVARLALDWNRDDNVGLVVGATQPDALRSVRRLVPEMWILAPGVGTQGGDLAAALQAGLRDDGLGLLIPVSRALSRAADVRQAAKTLRDQINAEREKASRERESRNLEKIDRKKKETAPTIPLSMAPHLQDLERADLADGLLYAGCVKFGKFTLKSGLESPIYLDLRQLVSFPRLLAQVASAYTDLLRGLAFNRLAALPYAALPIGAAISLQAGWPLIYPRKEAKAYGTKAEIEGLFTPGETVAVVDDLTTTGGSKFEAIDKLTAAGLRVLDVVVLIDRQSGAKESLAQAGYQLHTIFTLTELLDHWQRNGKVPTEQIAAARAFIGK